MRLRRLGLLAHRACVFNSRRCEMHREIYARARFPHRETENGAFRRENCVTADYR